MKTVVGVIAPCAFASSFIAASLLSIATGSRPEPPKPTPVVALRGSAIVSIDLEDGTKATFTIPDGAFSASTFPMTDGPSRLSFLASSPMTGWRWDVTGAIDVDIQLPPPPPGDGPFSDDFDVPDLDPRWASNVDASLEDGSLLLGAVAPADSWTSGNSTSRIWQPIESTDPFAASVLFSTDVTEQAMEGLHVSGPGWWGRVELQRRNGERRSFSALVTPAAGTDISIRVVPTEVMAMRATWNGSAISADYSTDGETWAAFGSFRPPTAPTDVGVYAGISGGAAPGTGFLARVDWFRFLVAPPPGGDDGGGNHDGGGDDEEPPPTDGVYFPLPDNVLDLMKNKPAIHRDQPDWDAVRRAVHGG